MLEFLRQPITFKRRRESAPDDAPAAPAQAPVQAAGPEPADLLGQAPAEYVAPAAVAYAVRASVDDAAPASAEYVAPASVEDAAPASAEYVAPASVEDAVRAPAEYAAPASVEYVAPASVENAAPASVEDAAPAPRRTRVRDQARRHHGVAKGALVGLDIEPGLLVAAKSHVNGGIVVEEAAFLPIDIDVVRDGEVMNVPSLAASLAELFRGSKLDRRVRIGIANQRILMRRIELPPLTDAAEIAQAVQFRAQDEIPMPLNTVVLDHHVLGIVERPEGPRLHVLLIAARRDMVERVLQAARLANLQPEGVDLAAFGMIRALHPAGSDEDERILYLSVGGLTNIAISRGLTCEFTRVIPIGVEQIASDLAGRAAISLDVARGMLTSLTDVSVPVHQPQHSFGGVPAAYDPSSSSDASVEVPPNTAQARSALDDGLRRIGTEVRNSLDFYLAAQDSGPVSRVILTGQALEIPGFPMALSAQLGGMPVERGEVASGATDVPSSVLPVAAGLSVAEGVR